ncbi:MAG: prepilin peptidase [Pirellulales bacterium]|nr:prepilin peptidase [Pirellulales bacterium]
MNLILAIPLEFRLAGLFVLGACLGSLVNLGVYRLAWYPRAISPWSPPPPGVPPRHAADRIPVFGWLGLRREAGAHGRGFWARPLMVELACAAALPWLYTWQTQSLGLLPVWFPRDLSPGWAATFHAQCALYVVFFGLMLVASLIDVDEKTIPDAITVIGTLAALVAAAACPLAMLPDAVGFKAPPGAVAANFWQLLGADDWTVMTITAPRPMPAALGGCPRPGSLALALACWGAWCFALARRDWYPRHGLGRAMAILLARLRRERSTPRILAMGAIGAAAIVAVWTGGGRGWTGLVTALVGMAASGGLVWAIRLIGAAALRREAMGFGDVTLMAMVGAWLGWQASILVFFLAPFAALAVGLVILVLHRENEIPYGPFLCLAALGVVLAWPALWEWAAPRFALGPLVPVVLVGCLVLLAPLLGLLVATIQAVKSLFR